MNRSVLVGIVVLVVLAAGAWYIIKKPSYKAPSSGNGTSQSSQSSTAPSGSSQNAADTITYDGNGFSPASLTVQSGATVTIKNTSSETVQFQSNPHPTHTDDTDLNVGAVNPGSSQTFTVTKKGTFGYHNHLNPSQQGSITIQ